MAYQIVIHNRTKEPKVFEVFGRYGQRRPAQFADFDSAREALRCIEMLRNDSAYDGAVIVEANHTILED